MNWIVATLLSALFLGIYDLCTKHAVRANAVTPVLFFSTLTGATARLDPFCSSSRPSIPACYRPAWSPRPSLCMNTCSSC